MLIEFNIHVLLQTTIYHLFQILISSNAGRESLLSQAGREVLIKAVVQAIQTYTMCCFKLPLGLCNKIEKLIRVFWWGQRGDRRKIHWVKWEKMCKPKSEGGMLFWPNKRGGCCTTQIICFTKCLSPSSFQTVLLWKPRRATGGRMLGGVF